LLLLLQMSIWAKQARRRIKKRTRKRVMSLLRERMRQRLN